YPVVKNLHLSEGWGGVKNLRLIYVCYSLYQSFKAAIATSINSHYISTVKNIIAKKTTLW
ncbi:hypothetical protein QT972_29195, partial [Microcoleus sp. herbarium7]|uniref:hypothetical protein n=1 Tax=Microcoleus sp. herbarium7 TaxID=3055435 RepID=UPI002FD738BC